MYPYLKGVHQTLDSWRSGRDEDGWKKSKRDLLSVIILNSEDNLFMEDGDTPEMVKFSDRLKDDLDALNFLLDTYR